MAQPREKPNISDWFNRPYDEDTRKARSELVLSERSVLDLPEPCAACDSSGECDHCNGTGGTDHWCDCDFCEVTEQQCFRCGGSGKCPECDGEGFIG